MDHVALMKKEWGFIEKILSGQKVIESRWYKNKYRPWDVIKRGELIYFKNSGEPVALKAKVEAVIQLEDLNSVEVKRILEKFGSKTGIDKQDVRKFYQQFRHKKYCILIFLKNPQRITSFEITKKGFGNMASWIAIENIDAIKI